DPRPRAAGCVRSAAGASGRAVGLPRRARHHRRRGTRRRDRVRAAARGPARPGRAARARPVARAPSLIVMDVSSVPRVNTPKAPAPGPLPREDNVFRRILALAAGVWALWWTEAIV